MKRREFTLQGSIACLAAVVSAESYAAITEGDAASGIRAALERGAASAVNSLGRTNGFLGNQKVRIELPRFVKDAGKLLKATGQGHRVDELVRATSNAM